MKIVPIFVNENNEGLHAISYNPGEDAFRKLFILWNDPGYILNYCKQYESQILGFYGTGDIETFVENVYKELETIEDVFANFKLNYLGVQNNFLSSIFLPLGERELLTKTLQQTKLKADIGKKVVLRIYALMISKNNFVVTGGCIKLARTMQQIPECNNELIKLEKVRKFLKSIDVTTDDDLIYYYESTN